MNAQFNNLVYGLKGCHRDRVEKNGLRRGYKAVTINGSELVELVDLRITATQSSTVYAVCWCYAPKTDTAPAQWGNGSGYAGGCDYHKASAAASTALRAAGLSFSEEFNGRGDTALKEAVKAAGMALAGSPAVYVVEMYP